MSQDTLYLLIGSIVGLVSATIGASVDYLASRKRYNAGERPLPGCMLLITGALGFIGFVVTITFYFFTGGIRPAIMTGIGVLGGFSTTFIILTMAWLCIDQCVSQDINIIDN